MAISIKDIIAAIAIVLNGLPLALLALNYGFAAFPTAMGLMAGCVGMVLTHQIAPISLQAESIVVAGAIGKDRNERLNIVFYTGVLMAIVGAFGLLNATIAFIGTAILNAMMAGVGLILAKSGFDMVKENKFVGGISLACALVVYLITNDLIWTVLVSVIVSTAAFLIKNRGKENEAPSNIDPSLETLKPLKLTITPHIVRCVLAVCTLQVGGNIAYATITAGIAGTAANVDKVTIYSGIADAVSAFFGGGPVEAIISGTAAAPHPMIAGVLLMVFLSAIMFSKMAPKLAKYVPSQSIGGFLFILGAFVVFPPDALAAMQEEPIVGGVVITVTSFTDPFIGMVSGVALKYAMSFFAGL